MIDKTEIQYPICCDMPRLASEIDTLWVNETDQEQFCANRNTCGDWGKIKPCEYCGDNYLRDDLTDCETYGHGLAICRPCHENAGGSWRCYTER